MEFHRQILETFVGKFDWWFPLKFLILSPIIIPGMIGVYINLAGYGVYRVCEMCTTRSVESAPA